MDKKTKTKTYPTWTKEQVAEKTDEKNLLIIVNGSVLDVTKFIKIHPGGQQVLKDYAGGDATTVFYEVCDLKHHHIYIYMY